MLNLGVEMGMSTIGGTFHIKRHFPLNHDERKSGPTKHDPPDPSLFKKKKRGPC